MELEASAVERSSFLVVGLEEVSSAPSLMEEMRYAGR